MATPDQIPSDLTLEIGENLPPDRFLAAVRHFLAYVEEMGKSVAPDGGAQDWLVRVKEGSNLIGVDPGPKAQIVPIRKLYRAIDMGLRSVASGGVEASNFPDAALRHLRTLSEMGQGTRGKPLALRMWIEKRPTVIGKEIATAIQEDWRSDYRDYGTVEGDLEAIQDRNGLQIRVRDQILRTSILCLVPEGMLKEAFDNFRKRVEISGLIHYRRNGTPISIGVDKIESLPDDSDLPSLSDVRGILRRNEWHPS
jgi:hypothetical protein